MLTFNYRSGSSLPRRTFIVNVLIDGTEDVQTTVIAPDQIFAQEIVRRDLTADPRVMSFWTYAIREVVINRNHQPVIRPFMLDGVTVRFPYFNGRI